MTIAGAAAWVTSSCRDLGLQITSPGERAHDRPWSSAVVHDVRGSVGTRESPSAGRVWFKASGLGTRHEPALVSVLASLIPDLVPEVLAIDLQRAWSLTADAGPTWRTAIPVSDHWPLWEDLLQRYATAQLELAPHRTTLLATGAPERSPATLPDQTAGLIAELSRLDEDCGGLSVADSEALTARLPAYGQWCRELDDGGIPSTIQHDDLHSNNICRTPPTTDAVAGPLSPSAGSRIIDWGDASIGHPFGTMLATLRSVAHHGGCELDDPRVHRVRDAYLEPFTTYASRSELVALVGLARRVGAIARALSWRAALIESPTQVHREHEFPVRGWLQEILANSTQP